jgi:hypothetical protein
MSYLCIVFKILFVFYIHFTVPTVILITCSIFVGTLEYWINEWHLYPTPCIGSLDKLGYEEMKLPTSLHETVLSSTVCWTWAVLGVTIWRNIKCLMDNQHLDKACELLVVIRDRLENWLQALAWLQRLDFCPSIGNNPGLLLAFFLDTVPWEDIFT